MTCSDLPEIQCDALALEQIIANVIDNAIKYSPRDKGIQVEVMEKKEKLTELRVIDNGAGIPDEDKKQIFEKFYQQLIQMLVLSVLRYCQWMTLI